MKGSRASMVENARRDRKRKLQKARRDTYEKEKSCDVDEGIIGMIFEMRYVPKRRP